MAALLRGCRIILQKWNVSPTFASMRSMASKTPVGFIGLGNMGSPMAKNLLKHGYPVIATDVFPESCKELRDLGAQVVDSPAEVAEKADRIFTMLPSSPNVIEVYTGPNGILKKVKKGTLLIDSSTIDPAVSKEMALAAEKMGAVFMDAPVSGGVGAASLAKLTFMVGGAKEEYNAAQELLTCMGANVIYCGQVGTGQAAKICNNMLLAIGMIGTAETMNLGIRLGLDPKLLAKILNMSSGRCWASDSYNPVPGVMEGVPSANNYQGGFGTTLMAKEKPILLLKRYPGSRLGPKHSHQHQDVHSSRFTRSPDLQGYGIPRLRQQGLLIRLPVPAGGGRTVSTRHTQTSHSTPNNPQDSRHSTQHLPSWSLNGFVLDTKVTNGCS
ncbi:3-hydroxyisobutyrate dehydrogenase a isoform 1-T1 [Syngnathus typhle]